MITFRIDFIVHYSRGCRPVEYCKKELENDKTSLIILSMFNRKRESETEDAMRA